MNKKTNAEKCSRCNSRPPTEGMKTCQRCRSLVKKQRERREARKKAFKTKDLNKRLYKKKINITPVQMQSITNELEIFIQKLPEISLKDYFEERKNLIKNILTIGK